MYMKSMVPYCDYNEKVYPSPVEGAVLLEESIKENGRWMIHMHIGPEAIAKNNIKAMSEAKCRSEIESRGGYLKP